MCLQIFQTALQQIFPEKKIITKTPESDNKYGLSRAISFHRNSISNDIHK